MRGLPKKITPANLSDQLRDAAGVTATLMQEIIGHACRRFPSSASTAKTARIERLIAATAWADAGLALIDLELPQWQLRRIAYDGGGWDFRLFPRRRAPRWLHQSLRR